MNEFTDREVYLIWSLLQTAVQQHTYARHPENQEAIHSALVKMKAERDSRPEVN